MDTLRISLFGSVQVRPSEQATPLKITRVMQSLLAYLLLQRPRSQPRELLADLFWGDQPAERAYSCLNTALWRLRQVLEPEGVTRGAYLVTTSAGEVSFNWESDYWLDVAVFEDQARRLLATPLDALSAEEAQATSQTLQLYANNLLEGFYDDWVLREREYLRQLQLSSLARLVTFHKERQAYQPGIQCAQQILAVEPLSEDTHRALMQLYTDSGQRTLAMRQYETCRALLAKELEIAPMAETQALFRKIRLADSELAAQEGVSLSNGVISAASEKQELRQLLDEAMNALEEVRRLLQRAINAG